MDTLRPLESGIGRCCPEFKNEAASLFGADVKQAGNVPIFTLGKDAWGVVIHPFWRHDAVIQANPRVAEIACGLNFKWSALSTSLGGWGRQSRGCAGKPMLPTDQRTRLTIVPGPADPVVQGLRG